LHLDNDHTLSPPKLTFTSPVAPKIEAELKKQGELPLANVNIERQPAFVEPLSR